MSPIKREVQIGDCRLLLGDCLEVLPTLGTVDHVVTDPPYEDELHAAFGSIRRIRKDGKHRSRHDTLGFEGVNANRDVFASAIVKATNGWCIIFTLAEGVRAWRDDLKSHGAKYDTCLAWVKPDAAPRFNGQGAARGFECAVTAWCGPGYRSWNSGGKRGVYTHCVNVGRHGAHPTEKPLPLMRDLVADFTQSGQTILDPFMGSGTTGLACLKLGRKFIGIELSEEHFETAVERVSDAHSRPDMFIEAVRPPEPKQEALL